MSLPNPDHALFFGYYYDISNEGNVRNEIKDSVNRYFNWAYVMSDLSQLNSAFADYVADGKSFIFGPNVNPSDTELTPAALSSLDVAAPYWSYIDIVFFDEIFPSDRAGLENFINNWKAEVAARGLAPKDVMVNFASITGPGSWQANNIDYVGFECYLPAANQDDDDITAQLNALIDNTMAFVGNERKAVLTIQGYDRGPVTYWTNMDTLKEMQTPPYLKAYNNAAIYGLLVFNYGRDLGEGKSTRELPPCIRTEHLRIWNAINSTTQPDEINCSGITPDPEFFYKDLACSTFCKQLVCNIPASLSGVYKITPGRTNDKLYSTIYSPTDVTTLETAIPRPSFKTGLIGDENGG